MCLIIRGACGRRTFAAIYGLTDSVTHTQSVPLEKMCVSTLRMTVMSTETRAAVIWRRERERDGRTFSVALMPSGTCDYAERGYFFLLI